MILCFCFNDRASTEMYTYLHTLSLHDALPSFDSVPLRSDLLFFDGDDPDQLAWALGVSPGAKLILTKGAPLELMKARQRRFYFDQDGKLIAHFGIRALPARVRQNGRVLEVSEVALPSRQGARQ